MFEDGMKSKYIERDWLESGIPCGLPATIDCEAESFTSGKQPISNTVFIAPIIHPESQPWPGKMKSYHFLNTCSQSRRCSWNPE